MAPEETARASVDFLLRESGPVAHVTFFGGETLLNFKTVTTTVTYARERAAALGKDVDFSITTNATLLKPEVIDFLLELLHRDVLPVIPQQGSLGSSGDLAPLAHLALVCIGGGEGMVGDERMSGGEALARQIQTPAAGPQ